MPRFYLRGSPVPLVPMVPTVDKPCNVSCPYFFARVKFCTRKILHTRVTVVTGTTHGAASQLAGMASADPRNSRTQANGVVGMTH